MSTVPLEIAPISRRLFAFLIDSVFSTIISAVIGYLVNHWLSSFLVGVVANVAFVYYFYSVSGATIGKSMLKIRPVNIETSLNLSPWEGVKRETVGHSISGIILGVGYMMAFFDADKRTLHDRIYKCVVVKSK